MMTEIQHFSWIPTHHLWYNQSPDADWEVFKISKQSVLKTISLSIHRIT